MSAAAPAAPRKLLVINPNTSESITALLKTHIEVAVGNAAEVSAITARFGAPYIADEASYAVAAHATLDAWAAALDGAGDRGDALGAGDRRDASAREVRRDASGTDLSEADKRTALAPDSILIGCFGDPGLFALRECSPVPVTGLAEAAFAEAARHGRFAIVTGGSKWEPMLRRLAHALGYTDTLAGIRTVAATGAQLAADPVAALALLGAACGEAVRDFDARSVILGGAGLAGIAARLQTTGTMAGVPIIDSVIAGATHALRLAYAPGSGSGEGADVSWMPRWR